MPPKPGARLYGTDGSTYRLGQELGKGAEGSVWSLDDTPSLVAKLYHKELTSTAARKLEAMCRLKSDSLIRVSAWPQAGLKESKSGPLQGMLMRRVSGHHSINQLYGIKSRLKVFPEAQFPFLLHVSTNIARAFATIHEAGQVIGDVNHSNLMVSQNATVAIIDCDSFQFDDGSKTYVCPVGVPEFTPPELQGISFASQARTAQHDAFGLSVLLFYLLFLGRHPFMGVFNPTVNDMLTIDQAIAAYKFPYALDNRSPEVRLPPFIPRLSDFPFAVKELFLRSFSREAVTKGRPAPHEWVAVLGNLSSAMRQCKVNQNHSHLSSDSCPWCRVEGVIGTAIFGIKISVFQSDNFNLQMIWSQIESVVPVVEQLPNPDLKILQTKHKPDGAIASVISRRRRYRILSIILVICLSLGATVVLSPLLAVLAIGGALIVGAKLWKKGASFAKAFVDQYTEAAAAHKVVEETFKHSASIPAAYNIEVERLAKAKRDFLDLAPQKIQRVKILEANREKKQRQHFLEKFRLEDERIPNIGDKTKLILYTWGILDAWDIEPTRITQIKGFGPVKLKCLTDWRASKERQFRFDPSQQLDPRDLLALEQEFQQKSSALKSSLAAGPQVLRQILSVWLSQRRQIHANLLRSADRLAYAAVQMGTLRVF